MNIKKAFLFLLLFSILFRVSAQINSTEENIKFYTLKIQNLLDKEKALSSYYSLDQTGISIYANAQNKKAGKPEFFLAWTHLGNFKADMNNAPDQLFEFYKQGQYSLPIPDQAAKKSYTSILNRPEDKKLAGLKIAIDPGHIAHDLATGDLEKKHLKFNKNPAYGLDDSVEISEGMLTYATALLLKEKLEKTGADVMLTRPEGYSAFGKTFEQWKKTEFKKSIDSLFRIGEIKADQKKYFLSPQAKDNDIFRVLFRDLDLAKRAERINEYKPDLTIIIHFNVDETNLGWTHPTKKDLNMTFVGGAFMKGDLSSPEKRFEFLRLLLSDHLEKSILLSSAVLDAFTKELNVPVAGIHDATYIPQSCMKTSKEGVYCRNLQLTRYVHSPLVYGESLYQDNINEAQLLNKETDKRKNERIQKVAEAYYQGILNYIQPK
jgi:N-acetylmuramoyl-L-alanine amidase